MGVLATATSLSGASLLLWISYSCYVMSGKSLVSKHCKHCKGASTICSMVTGLCAMPWSEEAKWWRRCWEFIRHLLLQLYLELSNARRRCDYPLWQRRCWDVTGDWGGGLCCKQGVPLQALDSLTSSFDWFITRGGGWFLISFFHDKHFSQCFDSLTLLPFGFHCCFRKKEWPCWMCSNQGSSLCIDAPFKAFEASIFEPWSSEMAHGYLDTSWIPNISRFQLLSSTKVFMHA